MPVASHEMFVGRRRELQKALRDEALAGVLLHGMGRLIVTSRFPFVLEGLEAHLLELPLPPLSETAQRKLALRQI